LTLCTKLKEPGEFLSSAVTKKIKKEKYTESEMKAKIIVLEQFGLLIRNRAAVVATRFRNPCVRPTNEVAEPWRFFGRKKPSFSVYNFLNKEY
jgi:hypothetical protein